MKSLVIYFSRADENVSVGYISKGNTEVIAEYIKEFTGADLFKVERKVPYARDYDTCLKESKEEKEQNQRPELARELNSLEGYDTIYIGAPIYWGTMPQPMFTQLEKLNFEGKNIKVFTTHEGNGIGSVLEDVKRICYNANVSDNALAIFGHEVANKKEEVGNWVNS